VLRTERKAGGRKNWNIGMMEWWKDGEGKGLSAEN
jgi:hypothetical protein